MVKSRPAWGAWIEIPSVCIIIWSPTSRPAWGAWIEIVIVSAVDWLTKVAPRMGRVD